MNIGYWMAQRGEYLNSGVFSEVWELAGDKVLKINRKNGRGDDGALIYYQWCKRLGELGQRPKWAPEVFDFGRTKDGRYWVVMRRYKTMVEEFGPNADIWAIRNSEDFMRYEAENVLSHFFIAAETGDSPYFDNHRANVLYHNGQFILVDPFCEQVELCTNRTDARLWMKRKVYSNSQPQRFQ